MNGLVKKIPALLTSASIVPNRVSAVSTTRSAVAGSAMSPSTRASLSEALIAELHRAVNELCDDAGVRAVVIAASGTAFSAGHDMKELTARRADPDRGRAYFAQVMNACSAMMQAIVQLPKPVVAAVQGTAVAAGCQLVATCDLAVAASTAVFGTPGVRIGLFCSTPMVAVSRAIGRKRALQLLLTGDVIDAATAADWGLINEVVAPDEVDARAFALAARVADASPLTLRIGKQAFYRQIDLPQEQAYAEMREIMATNAVTCDAQEGMQAFLDKRAPVWEGR